MEVNRRQPSDCLENRRLRTSGPTFKRTCASFRRAEKSSARRRHGAHAAVEFGEDIDSLLGESAIRLFVGLVPTLVFSTLDVLHDDAIAAREHVEALILQ